MQIEKAEVLVRLARLRDKELGARDGCERLLKCGSMGREEADRHVAECNRNAAALILAIELVEVHCE